MLFRFDLCGVAAGKWGKPENKPQHSAGHRCRGKFSFDIAMVSFEFFGILQPQHVFYVGEKVWWYCNGVEYQ